MDEMVQEQIYTSESTSPVPLPKFDSILIWRKGRLHRLVPRTKQMLFG